MVRNSFFSSSSFPLPQARRHSALGLFGQDLDTEVVVSSSRRQSTGGFASLIRRKGLAKIVKEETVSLLIADEPAREISAKPEEERHVQLKFTLQSPGIADVKRNIDIVVSKDAAKVFEIKAPHDFTPGASMTFKDPSGRKLSCIPPKACQPGSFLVVATKKTGESCDVVWCSQPHLLATNSIRV